MNKIKLTGKSQEKIKKLASESRDSKINPTEQLRLWIENRMKENEGCN